MPIAPRYNLEFEKYSKWIKEQSESLWKLKEDGHLETDKEALRDYVSPYLTRFEAKKAKWWELLDLGQSLRHLAYEVIPECFGGPDPAPKEDVFLLRAMEQPSFVTMEELGNVLEVDSGVMGGEVPI